MLDFGQYIESHKKQWLVEDKELALNDNCLKYPIHEDEEVFGICSPLLFAILQGETELALGLLKEGANVFVEETLDISLEARCGITLESFVEDGIADIARVASSSKNVSVDRLFSKKELEEWLKKESINPLNKSPLTKLEVELQPLYFTPQIMAVRLGNLDVLKAMPVTEGFHKDVLQYALLYNQSEIVKWALEGNEDLLVDMADFSIDLISLWLEKTKIMPLGDEAALLYRPAVDQLNLRAINLLLEKEVPITPDMIAEIIEIINGDTDEERLSIVLENDYYYICKLILENVDIKFEPEEDEEDFFFLPMTMRERKNDQRYAKLFLEHGADPNYIVKEYAMILYAAMSGNIDILQMFIDRGIDINFVSETKGYSPLVSTIDCGFSEGFQLLLAQDNIDVRTGQGTAFEPIIHALNNDKYDFVKPLLDRYDMDTQYTFTLSSGEDPEMFDGYMIHLMIQYDRMDIVQWIVDKNPERVHYRNTKNQTTWMQALSLGRYDMAIQLLAHCDLNQPVDFAPPGEESISCLPIYAAIRYGADEIVEWMVKEKGFRLPMRSGEVNAAIGQGTEYEPIVYAFREELDSIVKPLLDNYDMDAQYVFHLSSQDADEEEETLTEIVDGYPIHLMVYCNRGDLVQNMVEKKPERVQYQSSEGLNTWMLALSLGRYDMAIQLLAHCDLNQPVDFTYPGEETISCLPIHIAVKYNAVEVIKWMVNEGGFDLNQNYMGTKDTTLAYEMSHYSGNKMHDGVVALIELGGQVSEKVTKCTDKLPSLRWLKQLFLGKRKEKRKIELFRRDDGSCDAIISPTVSLEQLEQARAHDVFIVPCHHKDRLCSKVLNVDSERVEEALRSLDL